jgi:hypothetical protein
MRRTLVPPLLCGPRFISFGWVWPRPMLATACSSSPRRGRWRRLAVRFSPSKGLALGSLPLLLLGGVVAVAPALYSAVVALAVSRPVELVE